MERNEEDVNWTSHPAFKYPLFSHLLQDPKLKLLKKTTFRKVDYKKKWLEKLKEKNAVFEEVGDQTVYGTIFFDENYFQKGTQEQILMNLEYKETFQVSYFAEFWKTQLKIDSIFK